MKQFTCVQEVFHKHGILISYKKGQLFVRSEDTAQGVYFLESGQVLTVVPHDLGYEQILGIFEEGSIFGKVGSVIPQKHSAVNIEALTDCIVYRLSCEEFQNFIRKDAAFLAGYMRQVSLNNAYLLRLVSVLGEKDLSVRLVQGLLLLSDLYGEFEGDACTLRISFTQEQFASYLGMSREYFNKIINGLKKLKVIRTSESGNLIIPSLAALRGASAKDL